MKSLLVCGCLLVAANALQGQTIPIQNADFDYSVPAVHGASLIPHAWQATGESIDAIRCWNLPGSAAVALGGNVKLSQSIELVPVPQDIRRQADWRLVLAIDVAGKFTTADEPAEILAALAIGSQQPLASATFKITQDAPHVERAKPRVFASSFKRNSGVPQHAFDGDPSTIWHSNWGESSPQHPHTLTLDFGSEKTLRGFRYVPRENLGNGTLKDFVLQVSDDGTEWTTVLRDSCRYDRPKTTNRFELSQPVTCRAMRLTFVNSWRGDSFASCAELIPDVAEGFDTGAIGASEGRRAACQRFFLPLKAHQSMNLERVDIVLQVDSFRYVVVDRVHLFWVPGQATTEMLGKPNGQLGPDLLGAGSYGFRGLMIHDYPALPILEVRPDTPAARGKLRSSDAIVAVNGRPLPPGNLAPGFEWFESSHESILGRAALQAASEDNGRVTLNVLRGSDVKDVELRLKLPDEIAHRDFLVELDASRRLTADLLNHVVNHQLDNGSWKNNPVHTCLGGLALLSTGKQQYAERIKAAANWLMARHAEPDAGFYWHPAFSGIFLCEYFLATGDQRALPVIERLLRLMDSAYHTSKWGTEAFGHGPRGLPYGNKSLVAVMVHVLVFEALAQRCGIQSAIQQRVWTYLESAWSDPAQGGHGALGYNASFKDLGEFWSRTGLLALNLNLRQERESMQGPLVAIMHQRFPWMRNSHAYGEPGAVLGLLGLHRVNPAYFREILSQYRWWFALAWQPGEGLDFTIPHMGAPYMEGPVLINNGYALIAHAPQRSLHLTGSTNTNWLNVSQFPVPISDPIILRTRSGEITLRCKIPGPDIFYTTDGSTPDQNSQRYTKPFVVAPGSVVRAIAGSGTNTSNLVERSFGLNKSAWQIAAADGHPSNSVAIERARLAIDGDPLVCWVTDAGEGSRGYPYSITLDLGQPHHLQLASLRLMLPGTSARQISVQASSTPDKDFREIGAVRLDQFATEVPIELDQVEAHRYLRFTFTEPFADNHVLMLGEIDLR